MAKERARELVSVTMDLAIAGHTPEVIIDVVDSLLNVWGIEQRQVQFSQAPGQETVTKEPQKPQKKAKKKNRKYGAKPTDWSDQEKDLIREVLRRPGSRSWWPRAKKWAVNKDAFRPLANIIGRTEGAIIQMAKKINREEEFK